MVRWLSDVMVLTTHTWSVVVTTLSSLYMRLLSVDIYHASLPSVRIDLEYEFTPASITAFFAKVAQLDAERLHAAFTLKSHESSSVVQAARTEKERAATALTTAMYEVLSQRRLFSDFRVVRVVSKVRSHGSWIVCLGLVRNSESSSCSREHVRWVVLVALDGVG